MKIMSIHFNRGCTRSLTTSQNITRRRAKFTSSQNRTGTIAVPNPWSNKASSTSPSNAWSSSTTGSILLAIILAVNLLASHCEGHAGGARRLPDDVPPMDYDGVGARPPRLQIVQRVTPTSRVVPPSQQQQQVPQLEDPSSNQQNSTNFSHSEPFVPILYKPWWSPEQDQTTSDDDDESDNTVRKYIESANMPRQYDESGKNIVRKYSKGHSALNNRAIFDSPYRGRGSGGGRLNPFWQQLPDDLPSYSPETDNEQEYDFEPAEKTPADDNPPTLEPYFEPEYTIHCYVCNQSSSSSHNKINNDYCNLQRGLLTSCARGFNICLQYCDARSGSTVRACGRSQRKRNDWNCRVLRETIPTLAHCSECSHSACNTGMNCRLDAPYHVSLPTYLPPPPPPLPAVMQLEASLNRRRTFHRLQPRGANFIESPNHTSHYPRENKTKSIEIQPGPAGSDQFTNANSDQTHTSENTTHGSKKYEQQQIESEEDPDLDNKQHETNDESTTDLHQFIGGHITHNEDQQQFIGGQMIHKQSEDSKVMIGTNRRRSPKLTKKDSPQNIQEEEEEDGGSLGIGSTNDGSTIQGCTQNSGDPFAPWSASSTPLTESSNPLHPSSGGAIGTQPSSPVGAIGTQSSSPVGAIEAQPSSSVGAIEPQPSSSGGAIEPQPISSGGAIGTQPSSSVGAIEPQPSSSCGTIEPPTSSSVHLDLHIELPVSSSRRPIELEYAEFDPDANREQIEHHTFVYPLLSVSNDEKGTMLMCWCAAAMLLIL